MVMPRRRHRHRSLLVVPLVLSGLLVASPARGADTVLGGLLRPSTIRSYDAIQVFSDFDGSAYRLAILRAGQVRRLAVAPSRAPFDVDIGPDRNGRPQLVYTRCKVERPDVALGRNTSTGCDLVVFSLAGAGRERPVRNANTDGDEFAPALWKGRVAFARKAKGSDRAHLYTRQLGAPRWRRSERLPGTSGQTSSRGILELDLRAEKLAQIVRFARSAEVRLVNISARSVRRLSRVGVGEGGQFFVGVGFAGAHLGWALNCLVSCQPLVKGVYRYRLSTGALMRADAPLQLGGAVIGLALFAADGAYVIDGEPQDGGCGGSLDPAPRQCRLIRSQPLAFGPPHARGTQESRQASQRDSRQPVPLNVRLLRRRGFARAYARELLGR